MRTTLTALAVLAAAVPAAAQDYHFTRDIPTGGRLEISNITGNIDVTRATGRTAEISVTKTVRRGDGTLVKAIMEESGSTVHVCTIYLTRDPNRHTCNGDNNNSSRGDNVQVDMHYTVRVPGGVELVVDDVIGNVTASGTDTDVKLETVTGDISFDGSGATSLETVNGKIVARFSRADWEGSMSVNTVNGSLELTFPASLSADVKGETVNGSIESDFPITVEKGFGPKSFSGRIGSGGRRLSLETVNGSITLRKR